MTDYRTGDSIGARVKDLRRQRGIKSVQDLVDLMPGSNITASTIQNLESGRRDDLGVSQLLNLAYALRTTPAYLLAPLGRPADKLDLSNLAEGLASMTVIEFDAWLSGDIQGSYRWTTADELNDRNQLNALRELTRIRREIQRITAVAVIQRDMEVEGSPALESPMSASAATVAHLRDQASRLEAFLSSSGWTV